MRTDRASPPRIAGKLYSMEEREARPLVEGGFADWEYVPESKVAALTSEEKAEEPALKAAPRAKPEK